MQAKLLVQCSKNKIYCIPCPAPVTNAILELKLISIFMNVYSDYPGRQQLRK